MTAAVSANPATAADRLAQVSPAEVAKYQGNGGKLRLYDNPAGTNAFARFTMQKFQLDKKYGFELQIIPVSTTPAGMMALQAGGADMGTLNWVDISRMRNAGVKVVGVGPMLKWADHFVVPVNSAIKSIADLKGKKIGVVQRTNLNWIVLRTLGIKEYKIDLEKEATIHEGGPTLMRGLLEQGQLDFALSFNTLTPGMVLTGKFKVFAQTSEFTQQLGLPDVAFVLLVAEGNYAAVNPANIRAFMAAYREAIQILNADDAVWVEQGRNMKMEDAAIPPLRDEMRVDLLSKFEPSTEATIRKTFDLLFATAGAEVMGMTQLPDGFMTLEYQQ
jgi:ABC-type nitrate/sulfonate/bicarbonate transport system substrate-binding protein